MPNAGASCALAAPPKLETNVSPLAAIAMVYTPGNLCLTLPPCVCAFLITGGPRFFNCPPTPACSSILPLSMLCDGPAKLVSGCMQAGCWGALSTPSRVSLENLSSSGRPDEQNNKFQIEKYGNQHRKEGSRHSCDVQNVALSTAMQTVVRQLNCFLLGLGICTR